MALGQLLGDYSDQLAALVERASASVVQVRGRHARPATGFVFAPGRVLLAAHSLEHGNGLSVRTAEDAGVKAELSGVDPATDLAVLRAADLAARPLEPAPATHVGSLAVLLGRTWSGSIAASAGIVSVVGGPLRTGRGPAIEQVLRADVRVHPLGAGGPLVDAAGAVAGVATGASMRGLPLFIPGAIAWHVAGVLAEQGRVKRGFLGISAQLVRIPEGQRAGRAQDTGLLVVGVAPDSPASRSLLIGDVVVAFDGQPVRQHDDLLAMLTGELVGKTVGVDVIRGGVALTVQADVGEQA